MPLHPPGTLESGINADKMIGLVDPTTVTEVEAQPEAEVKKSDKIPLGQIIGLPDFAVRLSLQAALSLILLLSPIESLIFLSRSYDSPQLSSC
jgi:hypothetical protein